MEYFYESVCFTGCCFESLRKCSVLLTAVSISSLYMRLKTTGVWEWGFPVNIIYFNEKSVKQSSLTHGRQTTCYSTDILALFKSQGIS